MPGTSDEQAVFERFSKIYELGQADVMRRIERVVCGCDYGATSWTTLDEARMVGDMLDLAPGKRLLDVGSGSGWPGLFLAERSGCDIAMTDLPLTGLRIAVERAAADRLAGACWAAVADGALLPFPNGCFDAIFHSDVLCCLPEKLAVLESCRRVVRADGRMVFSVILISPDLSAAAHELAASSGPPFVDSDLPYPEMLAQAGWKIAEHQDLTADYMATLGNMVGQLESHADEIGAIYGDDEAADELARRRAALDALGEGLLRRELFTVLPS